MVVFDTTCLLHLLDPNLGAPLNPQTKSPVGQVHARVKYLVERLHENREKIIIPAPVLGELLILAERAGAEYFAKIDKSAAFKIEPFDSRAAVELSIITAGAIKAGDKKAGSTATIAKIKFDRQIVAIAKVLGASTIYTNDENLTKFAEANGLTAVAVWDLPLPEQERQATFWDVPEGEQNGELGETGRP
ncbi:MAG TPA: PIN domain-containing protein [Alphaproteobacteria bacterium]|nr:PIN domain-containing protein [Alphaproteobacteria bacterium]